MFVVVNFFWEKKCGAWMVSGWCLDWARQKFDSKNYKVMEELINILRKRISNRESARQLAEDYAALVVDENKLLIKDFNLPLQVHKVCCKCLLVRILYLIRVLREIKLKPTVKKGWIKHSKLKI